MIPPPPDLERIRVRFATFRDRTIDERAAYAESLGSVRATERVLLDTCHRVELVMVTDDSTVGPTVVGRDAVRRVLEVVAGFDSAVVAEEQLLGQARRAYEAAMASGTTGPILNELFRRALRFGRRVRSHARPGTDRSLADRGATWLLEKLGADPASVVVAGTGEMGRRAAARLGAAGHAITLVTRSAERGSLVIGRLPGSGHRLAVGELTPATAAVSRAIVLAVRSRQPMLTAAHLDPGPAPWTLDLSTPAAVASEAVDRLGERLLGLDALGRVAASEPVLTPAAERRLRTELEREVESFVAWLAARTSGTALAILHGEAESVRRRHLDRLTRNARFGPEQLAAVEAASAAMLGELLHGPTLALRSGGADADAVRRLFRLDS